MAQITLKIVANNEDALKSIKAIKDSLHEIETHPIKINIQASGLDAVAEKIKRVSDAEIKATEAAAKLANAEARKIDAERKAAESAAKLANATNNVANSEKQAATAMSLTIRNAGHLESKIRGLASAYNELAQAQRSLQTSSSGGGIANTNGGTPNAGTTGLYLPPHRTISWDTNGTVIDVDWEPVANGANNAANAVNNAANAAEKAHAAFNSMRDGMRTAWNTMNQGTPIADALRDSIGNIIVKITTWQVVNGIVANIKRAFTDALATMKEVDQELTNIQKVSNLTASEIKRIGDSAYETASKYGVAAKEYLEAVYTFQKAGLGDNAEKLGELAVKTMLVGDTTAEVATKFLIAGNAAFKYGGDIGKLNHLVDTGDYLNNNYAVSLQDIAMAFPIVAATAAQAGLSVEQTMAALTTIVSQTAMTGNRAGTALRAIIMNLAGETGELEDGFEVTEETIKSLNGLLMQFEPEAVAAAKAAGTIVDPMKAISAIAKGMAEDVLTSGELFEMVSQLGGKLRANPLNALIEGQETYNKALAGTAQAAGTADKEISIMLESWNAKTQILTNTFTKFISHLVDSNGIKVGIEVLTGFVKILDSGIGKVTALTGAFLLMGKAIAAIYDSKAITFIVWEIYALVKGAISATTAIGNLWAVLSVSPLFWAAAAATAIYGLVKLYDALNVTAEEHLEKAQKALSEYDALKNEIDDLTAKQEENNRLIAKANELGGNTAYADRLQVENERLQEQINYNKTRAQQKAQESADEAIAALRTNLTGFKGAKYRGADQIDYARRMLSQYGESDNINRQLGNQIDLIVKYQAQLLAAEEAGAVLTEDMQLAVAAIDELVADYVALTGGTSDAATAAEEFDGALTSITDDAEETAGALETLRGTLDDVSKKLGVANKAFKDFDENGKLSYSVVSEIIDSFKDLGDDALATYIDRLTDANLSSADLNTILGEMTTQLVHTKVSTGDLSYEELNLVKMMLDEAGVINSEAVALGALTTAKIEAAQKSGDMQSAIATSIETLSGLEGQSYNTAAALHALNVVFSHLNDFDERAANYKKLASASTGRKAALYGLKAKAILIEKGNYDAAAAFQAEYNNALANFGGSGVSFTPYAGSGSSSSGTVKDIELENRKQEVADEKARYNLMEAQGVKGAELAAQAVKVQEALHKQAEYMRSIDAEYADVAALSIEWHNWEEKKKKALSESDESYSKTVEALKNQLSFLEASNASDDERIAKMRQIQDALHVEAEYMRSIKADEEDIRKLSIEWWQIQNNILKLQEEAAAKRKQDIANSFKAIADGLADQETKMLEPLQAQLDALNEANSAAKERREEEEKILATEKARFALENAQNERTIRLYNARTGQWESVADARNVEAAQKSLIDAQTNLAEFYTQQQYEAAKKNLESQINLTKDSFSSMRNAINYAAERIMDGSMVFDDAYAYISDHIRSLYAGAGIDLTSAVNAAGGDFHSISATSSGGKPASSSALTSTSYYTGMLMNLRNDSTGTYRKMLERQGILTSSQAGSANLGHGSMTNNVGSQHNGDVIYINGVQLKNITAKSSVNDIVVAAKNLSLLTGG